MPTGPPAGQRSTAVLVAAGVVAIQGAALLAFAGWNLLHRSSEEPSNQGVFQGATASVALLGALVMVVAGALVLHKRWAFGAAVFVQLLGLGVVYQMATARFWLGAVLLGLSCGSALLGLFSGSTRAALGRS